MDDQDNDFSTMTVSAGQLRAIVERIERLEEEKKEVGEQIRELYAEAKGNGFDVKTMRQILKLRKLDKDDLQEQEHLLELYKRAIGLE